VLLNPVSIFARGTYQLIVVSSIIVPVASGKLIVLSCVSWFTSKITPVLVFAT
jgi:hypothetical protein